MYMAAYLLQAENPCYIIQTTRLAIQASSENSNCPRQRRSLDVVRTCAGYQYAIVAGLILIT